MQRNEGWGGALGDRVERRKVQKRVYKGQDGREKKGIVSGSPFFFFLSLV
jgi:hypothetical protein